MFISVSGTGDTRMSKSLFQPSEDFLLMLILCCERKMQGELENLHVRGWGRSRRHPRGTMLQLQPEGDGGVLLETGRVQVF